MLFFELERGFRGAVPEGDLVHQIAAKCKFIIIIMIHFSDFQQNYCLFKMILVTCDSSPHAKK